MAFYEFSCTTRQNGATTGVVECVGVWWGVVVVIFVK